MQIHHVSLLIADLPRAIEFYRDTLGLQLSDNRPDLGFDGAWFELGAQQIHLICEEPGTTRPTGASRCGRDRHVAFQVEDIESLRDKLSAAGIAFETSRSGRPAIFCRDPDGNALEFIGKQ